MFLPMEVIVHCLDSHFWVGNKPGGSICSPQLLFLGMFLDGPMLEQSSTTHLTKALVNTLAKLAEVVSIVVLRELPLPH